jgi:hypothetical protein
MKTIVMFVLLAVALAITIADDVRVRALAALNDGAATECAMRTGYKYNCTDGSQAASCK